MELRTIRQDKQQSRGGNWELGVGNLRIKNLEVIANRQSRAMAIEVIDRRSSVPLDNTEQNNTLCARLCRLPCKNYELVLM